VEHVLTSFALNRIHIGYQYWQASGHDSARIVADIPSSANYTWRVSQSSHMIRLTIKNDIWLDDEDPARRHSRRRSGLVQMGGVLIGIDGSILIFAALGPVWGY
jgi:hypothetical protein